MVERGTESLLGGRLTVFTLEGWRGGQRLPMEKTFYLVVLQFSLLMISLTT